MPDDQQQQPIVQTSATQKISISEFIVEIPRPFSPGQPLDEAAAKQLNQVFSENIRNNCTKMVKKAKEDAGEAGLTPEAIETLRSAILTYANSYTFAGRTRAEPVDPIEKEAYKLASEAYKSALRAKGIDPKDIDKDKFSAFVEDLVNTRPKYREEAARRFNSLQDSAEDLLSAIGGAAA